MEKTTQINELGDEQRKSKKSEVESLQRCECQSTSGTFNQRKRERKINGA